MRRRRQEEEKEGDAGLHEDRRGEKKDKDGGVLEGGEFHCFVPLSLKCRAWLV